MKLVWMYIIIYMHIYLYRSDACTQYLCISICTGQMLVHNIYVYLSVPVRCLYTIYMLTRFHFIFSCLFIHVRIIIVIVKYNPPQSTFLRRCVYSSATLAIPRCLCMCVKGSLNLFGM